MAPWPYGVVDRVVETGDTVSVRLTPFDQPIERPRPGQFVMAWVMGVGEIPISVSAVSGDDLVLSVRAVGAVSSALIGTGPGEPLGVRGPFGTAWPTHLAAGRTVLVVAGGLGLAPLKMAVDDLVDGDAPAARVTLVVGARAPDQLLFRDAIRHWEAAGARVHLTVDAADRSWHGAVGTATAQLERLGLRDDLAFVCGPEIMMTSAARAVTASGTAPGDVWVSLERNMHCGVAHCGRCQLGPLLLCRDGAVVRWDTVADLLEVRGR
jgi:NAD(P)H-flavin reductase